MPSLSGLLYRWKSPNVLLYYTITACSRAVLMSAKHRQRQKHWTGLKLQGKLACLSSAEPYRVSHHSPKYLYWRGCPDLYSQSQTSGASNPAYSLHLVPWLSFCILHGQDQVIESMSHILNGWYFYKELYTSGHDRIVDIISKNSPPTVSIHIVTLRFLSTS